MPNVDIDFFEGSLSVSRDKLRDGTLDFITANLPANTRDTEFDINPICTMKNVIGLRQKHAIRPCKSLADLGNANWLVPGSQHGGRALLKTVFDLNKLPTPERVMRCQSLTLAFGLMGSMDMPGIFAKPLAERVFKQNGLKIVCPNAQLPMTSISVITRKEGKMSAAAQRFADTLVLAAQNLKDAN